VGANGKGTPPGQPVPDLPVADIERAQQHYRLRREGQGSDEGSGGWCIDPVSDLYKESEGRFIGSQVSRERGSPAVAESRIAKGRWRKQSQLGVSCGASSGWRIVRTVRSELGSPQRCNRVNPGKRWLYGEQGEFSDMCCPY